MSKGSRQRPRQISDEEYELRWAYGQGKLTVTVKEFNERIKEIRRRTGKP